MNNQEWFSTIKDLLTAMPGHPVPGLQMALILFAGAVGFVLILSMLARIFEIKRSAFSWILALMLLGFCLTIACLSAFCIYLQPRFESAIPGYWLVVISLVVIFLVLLVPMGCLFLKSKYFAVAVLLILSAAAGAGAMLLMRAGYDAVAFGSGQFDGVKSRTDSIDNAIKKEK